MANPTVVIVAGTSLTYTPKDGTNTSVLSKWICDKHFDTVLIKSAFGNPIFDIKVSATNPITIDTVEFTDATLAQAAIGANW